VTRPKIEKPLILVDLILGQPWLNGRIGGDSELLGKEKLGTIDDGLVHALDGRSHGTENDDGIEGSRLSPSMGVFASEDSLIFFRELAVFLEGCGECRMVAEVFA
jgi:hypothetical protein